LERLSLVPSDHPVTVGVELREAGLGAVDELIVRDHAVAVRVGALQHAVPPLLTVLLARLVSLSGALCGDGDGGEEQDAEGGDEDSLAVHGRLQSREESVEHRARPSLSYGPSSPASVSAVWGFCNEM
jgi:hypothetical protein